MLLSFQIRLLFCRLILFPNIYISESIIRLQCIEILNVQTYSRHISMNQRDSITLQTKWLLIQCILNANLHVAS